MTCSVRGCGNYMAKTKKIEGESVKYFSFPKDPLLIDKWREVCGKENINPKNARICSKHFSDDSYTKSLQQQLLGYSPKRCKKLRPDAIPTLYVCAVSLTRRGTASNVGSVPEEISNDVEEIMPPSNTEAILSSRISCLELEVAELRKEIDSYKKRRPKEDKELVKKKMFELLGNMFSPGQIRVILNPSARHVKWSFEDIDRAAELQCISPRAYRYMKDVLRMPLPSLSTLRRYAGSIEAAERSLPPSPVSLEGKNNGCDDTSQTLVHDWEEP